MEAVRKEGFKATWKQDMESSGEKVEFPEEKGYPISGFYEVGSTRNRIAEGGIGNQKGDLDAVF
jgi:hypothetical protein